MIRPTRTSLSLYFIAVLILSYFTYFRHYSNPPYLFWDENYHIASACKYLNGVFFMENHPPLGKLLIAAGEKLWHANPPSLDQLTDTDYIHNLPNGFSFRGFRFFPALLGWLTAPLVFLIFLLITGNALWAFLLSFLYIFDNALIVHERGAMIESPLMFLTTLMILQFILLIRSKNKPLFFFCGCAAFGLTFGLIMTTKLVGLIMILLILPLLYELRWHWGKIAGALMAFLIGSLVTYIGVWQIHFSLGKTIENRLENGGYYQASNRYKEILANHENGSLREFPVMIRESWAFVGHYNRGVPRLDLCKQDENGSPFFMWPLGARSINYRWETPDGKVYRYLYLQCNPVIWLCGVLGVLLSLLFLSAPILMPVQQRLKNPVLLITFTGMYVAYMISMSRIDRVMYLYHYFTPLLFSFILFGLILVEMEQAGHFQIETNHKTISLLILGCLIIGTYRFYKPLTYYQPLSDSQLSARAWLHWWDLHSVRSPRDTSFLTPCH